MSPALLWGIAALAAAGIELFTADLTFILIAAGAASAALVALLGAPLWVQVVVGVGVSVLGIALVRPVALRHLRRAAPPIRTGVDALPGTRARALTDVTERDGRITLRGEVWSARLDPDVTTDPVTAGGDVLVTRIDGATALVYPVDPR